MLGLQDAADRDHDAGRHSGGHRPRLVRAASRRRCSRRSTRTGGACCIRASWPSWRARSRSTGCGEPIGKQDQYIAAYGGVTCFTFHPDEQRRGRAAAHADGRAVRPRGQPAAVLHRLLAERRQHPRGSEDAHASGTTPEMLENLHYVKELGLPQPRRARARRHGAVRRAHARALGAQEAPLRRHEQSADRRVVRARPEERRDRRQARRRRRRRLPDVLRRGSPAAARRDGEAPASRKCASGSTSKARRCCSREPAGRDPRRRAGDAPAAAHASRFPKRSSTSPAGRLPSTSSSCCGGQAVTRGRLLVWLSRRADRGGARRRRPVGHAVRRTCTTVRCCSAPAARSARAAAAGRRVLRPVRRLVSASATSPPSSAPFAGERPARPDDRLPERRPRGTAATSSSTDGRIVRYDKTDAHAGDAPHRLRARRAHGEAFHAAMPPDEPFDLATRLSGSARRGAAGRLTRSHDRFYEIGSPEGLEDTDAYLLDATASAIDELRRTASGRSRADRPAARSRGDRAGGRDRSPDVRDARRPAVLPRRRRQRRQLLARRQRLPQDRRLRGLRADRQRLGADRADQRRGLGDRLRRVAARAAGCARRTRVFVFSVGGGSLEKNISPNLVRALEYAKRGRRHASSASSAATAATRRQVADACVIVPTVNPETVTPHAEAFQAVVWHLLVSHPALKAHADEVGIDAVTRPGRLPRPRRRDQPRDRAGRQAVSAGVGRRARDPAGRAGGARAAASRRLPARRRHQPARRRARQRNARASSRRSTHACGRCCRSTRFASAPTTTRDGCACRKPKPGLLLQPPAHDMARQRHGRRPLARHRGGRPPGAARRFSSTTATPKRCRTSPTMRVGSLAEAADWILSSTRSCNARFA